MKGKPELYHNNRELFYQKLSEGIYILEGGNQTGKTSAIACFTIAYFLSFPNANILILRKRYTALVRSALLTFHKCCEWVFGVPVTHPASPIYISRGGINQPEQYKCRLGTGKIDVIGSAAVEDIQSAEYDLEVLPQVEELEPDEFALITRRCTGRSNQAPIWGRVGDCNPSHEFHHLLALKAEGIVKMMRTTLKSNPFNFNHQTGEYTQEGLDAIRELNTLTGALFDRLRLGKWATAEGAVFPMFSLKRHVLPFAVSPPEGLQVFGSIDFGSTAPFSALWYVLYPSGVVVQFAEIYMSETDIVVHGHNILAVNDLYDVNPIFISDIDKAGISVLRRMGIKIIEAAKGQGSVAVGTSIFQHRLHHDTLFFVDPKYALVERDAKRKARNKPQCLIEELSALRFKSLDPEKYTGTLRDEVPDKESNADHAFNSAMYFLTWLETAPPAAKFTPRLIEANAGADLPSYLQ